MTEAELAQYLIDVCDNEGGFTEFFTNHTSIDNVADPAALIPADVVKGIRSMVESIEEAQGRSETWIQSLGLEL